MEYTTKRDLLASELAMLALTSDPETDDFVMVPAGATVHDPERAGLPMPDGLVEVQYQHPDLGPITFWVEREDLR